MSHIEQIPPELTYHLRWKVLYPDAEPEAAKLEEDDKGMHFGLFEDGVLVSVVSLFVEDRSVQMRKFATREQYQRRGYGSELLHYVLFFSRAEGFERIWCNARTQARGFYRNFGFSETPIKFQKNGIQYVIMEKPL